ncbi:MAG: RNA 2',3'-cyclic phosphodiesterase [Rhodocyclaceae bacterium]|nr:RNA 2',3'-cyclic phosphodiesterase [Rhodocyclaceae bacterium]
MPDSRRVFFALWPDDGIARLFDEAGSRAHRSLKGRRMRRETLHLTLAFIGSIAPERLAQLEDIASAIRLSPFDLLFDRLQCLPRKKIAWASAGVLPAELRDLAANLNAQLKAAGFRTEERPFAAHVTLLRNADCAAGKTDDSLHIGWPVRDFVLAESELKPEGAHYRIIGRWPLAQT